MSLADFLAWEARQPLRHESDGFQPVAMTGGTASHARIQRNLVWAVGGRLRGKRCEFFGSELKIEVDGRIRYPDGFVTCTPVSGPDKVVRDPVVIFEVLSDGTAQIDLVDKNRDYAATPSVKRYIMRSQDRVAGTVFERVDGTCIGRLIGTETILVMTEIGIELPLSELYEDVPIRPNDDATSAPSP